MLITKDMRLGRHIAILFKGHASAAEATDTIRDTCIKASQETKKDS